MCHCDKCKTAMGIVMLVLALVFLLKDLNVWNFWGINWWTIGFVLMGLCHLAGCHCPECKVEVKKKKK